MFDRHDELTETLARLAEIASSDANAFGRAQQLIEGVVTLSNQLDALRAAALTATEHRAKRDLARDLGASPNALFPPQSSRGAASSPVVHGVADATVAA